MPASRLTGSGWLQSHEFRHRMSTPGAAVPNLVSAGIKFTLDIDCRRLCICVRLTHLEPWRGASDGCLRTPLARLRNYCPIGGVPLAVKR